MDDSQLATAEQNEGLRALVEELQATIAATPSPMAAPEKQLSTRERDSLLKLIIGMAVGGYGYDVTEARSKQPAVIADDLDQAGVHLDVDTVGKWLREAAAFLPGGKDPTR